MRQGGAPRVIIYASWAFSVGCVAGAGGAGFSAFIGCWAHGVWRMALFNRLLMRAAVPADRMLLLTVRSIMDCMAMKVFFFSSALSETVISRAFLTSVRKRERRG